MGVPLGKGAPCKSRKSARPLALKLCAGHARLTASLVDHGFEGLGTDWRHNKHDAVVPILEADLSKAEGQELTWRIMQQGRVKYIHMGPPCGTASRAREKRIPKWLRQRGAPDPQP